MKNIIQNIRSKPEQVRRHILHVSVATCGVILILLWIYSLGATLASPSVKSGVSDDLKPFSALKANIVGGYNSITQPQQ